MGRNIIETKLGLLDRMRPEDWQYAKDLYAQGKGIPDIALEYGLSIATLHRLFVGFNWPKRSASEARSLAQEKMNKTTKERYGVGHISQSPEFQEKLKTAMQEKYGVDHQSQLSKVKEKVRKTMQDRYGVDNAMQSKDLRERFERSLYESHGVSYPAQSADLRLKQRESLLAHHGVMNPMQSKDLKERQHAAVKDHYGVEYPAQSSEVQETIRSNNLEKYGVECTFQAPIVLEKIKGTLLERYGVEHPSSSPEICQKRVETIFNRCVPLLEQKLAKYNYVLLDRYQGHLKYENGVYLGHRIYRIKHEICGLEFEDDIQVLPRCPKCFPLKGNHRSQLEDFYSGYIRSLGVEVITSSRDILRSTNNHWYEADIALPDQKIIFEVNGLFWHSTAGIRGQVAKSIQYHKNKTEAAIRAGYRLFHIWEHFDPEIVKSKIRLLLGLINKKIYARSTEFRVVSRDVAEQFLTLNHLHGFARGFIYGALYYGDHPVLMVALRDLGSNIEIARFATTVGITVQGGFQKALKSVLSLARVKRPEAKKLITYADRDWSPIAAATVYHKTGFTFLGDTGPSMYYTDFKHVYFRQTFQKHKLAILFPETFDPGLTEVENLSLQKIYPFYTSGNWKFELEF